MVSIEAVTIDRPDGVNVIIGQAHFIKTVEDLHETLAGASPHLRFGVGFCEASAARLVRRSGNDPELTELAARNALAVGAGHAFIVMLRDGFPINVLTRSRPCPRCAPSTARPPTTWTSWSRSPTGGAGWSA